jgi:hypothetical protein
MHWYCLHACLLYDVCAVIARARSLQDMQPQTIALETHPTACIFGEDVGFGGVFRASADLQVPNIPSSTRTSRPLALLTHHTSKRKQTQRAPALQASLAPRSNVCLRSPLNTHRRQLHSNSHPHHSPRPRLYVPVVVLTGQVRQGPRFQHTPLRARHRRVRNRDGGRRIYCYRRSAQPCHCLAPPLHSTTSKSRTSHITCTLFAFLDTPRTHYTLKHTHTHTYSLACAHTHTRIHAPDAIC